MVKFVNRAKMTTSTTGTGTITLGSAADGYQSFADAGVSNGDTVRYVIEDGNNAFEIGVGTYGSSGTTLSRSVTESSNSDSAINLSGSASVFLAVASQDLSPTVTLDGAVTGSGTLTDLGDVTITTTATSDPTITLSGDASGSATLTNLGSATLSVTVADDSHNHVISNVDGLQSALDGKLSTSGNAATATTAGTVTTAAQPNITSVGTLTTLNINGALNAVDDIYLAGTLYHEGDTNTYLTFGTDTITLTTGGSNEVTINTSGVRLGDSGNGYFQPVTGTYGSIQIDGGAHSAYEGYSIGGRVVFMHNNSTTTYLYNDVDGEAFIRMYQNGSVSLYNNGSVKLETSSSGVNLEGDLNAVDNIYVADKIYHEGDTDTYVEFATNTINLYTGGTQAHFQDSGLFLYDGSLAEDYDALSGTSPTCNVDNGGAFSLTMSGNTTFTFSGAASGFSQGFILQLTGNGSTVTWPNSVDWAGGSAPDAPANGESNLYSFYTRDGGSNWVGVLSAAAYA